MVTEGQGVTPRSLGLPSVFCTGCAQRGTTVTVATQAPTQAVYRAEQAGTGMSVLLHFQEFCEPFVYPWVV